ncbi:MAG: hypothetical protein OER86_08045, partial [Phycisphaerae bacterium]|nr:hypothetical protein [Phycisphaerae bacterium]
MRSLLILLLLAGLAAPTSAAAEEAAELFKSLYADRIAQVEQTPAAEDDVELAGQMLEARETLGEQPTLGFLLYQHAGRLAARSPAGLETAVQAIKGMAALDHPGRLAAARKITNAVQATYTRSRGAEARKAAGASLVDAMSHVAALAEQEGKLAVGITTLQRASSVASAVVPDRSAAVKAELDRLQQFQRAEREAAILRDR